MDNTYNIDFIARCIAGHNKTAIKSIITELETNKNNISSIQQTIGDINSVLEEVL